MCLFSCDKYLKHSFCIKVVQYTGCQGSAISTNSNWQTLFELDILVCSLVVEMCLVCETLWVLYVHQTNEA